MRYEYSDYWTVRAREIALKLNLMKPDDLDRVVVITSRGSSTRRTIARIHGLGKAMQVAMREKPFYAIELIEEKFLKQSEEEKTKTIIHELMHVPASFGGGFRMHHPYVTEKTVEAAFRKLTAQ
jgi:predicted metallopeptidase